MDAAGTRLLCELLKRADADNPEILVLAIRVATKSFAERLKDYNSGIVLKLEAVVIGDQVHAVVVEKGQ
ncbi:MAG: hypothetical protein KDI38_09390 [Calditrichaeota bacterium]|nr:hypothetical protein [Calditrichota bacterium]